jgi:hypothetical protein
MYSRIAFNPDAEDMLLCISNGQLRLKICC